MSVLLKPIDIGSCHVDFPVMLAPMAGVSDLAFRILCHRQGAGLVCTEMVSAKAIYYKNKGTDELMMSVPEERPLMLQLFGSDPELMAAMAAQVEDGPWDIIDINMGCPVPKVVKNGDGSALLQDIPRIEAIVSAMTHAVKKPVTVKIRKGFGLEDECAAEAARAAEAAGAAAALPRVRVYRGVFVVWLFLPDFCISSGFGSGHCSTDGEKAQSNPHFRCADAVAHHRKEGLGNG